MRLTVWVPHFSRTPSQSHTPCIMHALRTPTSSHPHVYPPSSPPPRSEQDLTDALAHDEPWVSFIVQTHTDARAPWISPPCLRPLLTHHPLSSIIFLTTLVHPQMNVHCASPSERTPRTNRAVLEHIVALVHPTRNAFWVGGYANDDDSDLINGALVLFAW